MVQCQFPTCRNPAECEVTNPRTHRVFQLCGAHMYIAVDLGGIVKEESE